MDEIVLIGGRTTQGVVLIGDLVHRPVKVNSAFVHDALRFLELSGCDFVPRFKGIDDKSREILTFIPGDVPKDLAHFEDKVIQKAAILIKKLHEYGQGEQQLIHNDLSPCNFVFVDEEPKAVIDFDTCCYGEIWADLGYAIWRWLDLGNDRYTGNEQIRRIRIFSDSYGELNLPTLLEAVLSVQRNAVSNSKDSKHRDWAQHCLNWCRDHLADKS